MPHSSQIVNEKTRQLGRNWVEDTAETKRLLGHAHNNDVEAFIITKPSAGGWGNMSARVIDTTAPCDLYADGRKPLSGGPRPTNTLNRSNNLPDIRSNRNSASTIPPSKPKKLELTSVRGINVEDQPVNTDLAHGYSNPPSAKRRKMEVPISPSTSTTSADESFMSIPGDQFIATASQSMSRTPSSQGQKSFLISRTGRNGGCVPEYRKVENMMSSDSKGSIKKCDRSNGNPSRRSDISKSSSPLMDAFIRRDSISLEHDGRREYDKTSETKPAYKGTARTPAQRTYHNGANLDPNPGSHTEPSPYFPKPTIHTQDLDSVQVTPRKRDLKDELRLQTPNLNSQFVQVNGKRRGGPYLASSPDELTSGTTVGNQTNPALPSPSKRPRIEISSKTSSSTLKSPGMIEDLRQLEPSNIRVSQFTTARTHKKTARSEEASPPWGYGLEAINLPAKHEYHKDQDLGLVHDQQNDIYSVIQRGVPAKFPGTTSQIVPRKLLKVHWERDGRKLRFESSRSGNEDNILDIELSSEKIAADLVKRLQRNAGSIRILSIPSEKINSMFERRRNEQRTHNVASTYTVSESADTVSLPQRTTTTNSGRTVTKLVEGLMSKAEIKDTSDHKDDQISSSRPHGLPSNEAQKRSKISTILEDLKPEHNKHLRRSTRTSVASNWLSAANRNDLEDPEVPKYSKIYGLGPQWKKPLTYPKVGKKKATVDWVDLERLDEGEFLNDTLVTFYMRYLEHQVEQQNPDLAKRIYFFSTFFYERLISTLKETKEINYEAVRKWTRTVDIFTYDYVVVPINEQAHWYLAIICNLPALDRSLALSDDETPNDVGGQPVLSSSPTSHGSGISATIDFEPLSTHREGSAEEGTTESFAELSLDNSEERSHQICALNEVPTSARKASGNVHESKADDAEMLDIGERSVSNVQVHTESADHITCGEDAHDLIKDVDHKPSVSATTKKPKRKSHPPITHIDPKRPLILTLDSLGSPHGIAIKVLKDYLREEGRSKRGGMQDNFGLIKGINAKCIPHQNNFSDCGLYMLGYVEKFLLDNPPDFIAKIIKREYESKDWSSLVPSDMRTAFREQLQELHRHQDDEHRVTKAQKRGAEDPDASSPVLSSATPADAPPEDVPSNQASPQKPLAPAPATREEALNAACRIDEAPADKSSDRDMRGSSMQTSTSPNHEKHHFSRAPSADLAHDEASVVLLDSQNRRESQIDVLNSQPKPGIEQQNPKSDPPELPSEIEDSQPAQSIRVASPSRAEAARTPPPEITKQAESRSPTYHEVSTTTPSKGKKLGRPRKHRQEEAHKGGLAKGIPTVVLD